ncbi:uncharacterized protein LOC127595860 [Hippocampus zosterae]|uniref:uncharacterized protein LOC127595860 n=1 Tax=Hippocampus zosterae TaxID=109293 RepID=UPI00223D699C|nr:uncharacterized protein LOC127595860 [Hippocampus zosterae]
MAEEGSFLELEGLEKQLQSLIRCYFSDGLRGDVKTFCSDYCKLVEEYASRWRSPLPRLRILEAALSHFTQASSSFTSNCDHVRRTLSSLALSVFELLLFFDERDFHKEPLKHFQLKFQECYSALLRHQNVHLVQVEPLLGAGGPWANTTLKEILSESNVPQNEVDRFLSSESPVFLELRVRYLISRQRVGEALALAKCCIRHPSAGKHLFFLQVYLTWLYKTQCNRLLQEVADLSGKEAVHIICSLENEETNELLLALCQVFLSQQLCRGDMYYLWELVFIWSKLHHRQNTSKEAFLEESRRLALSAANVNAVFPFVRVVTQELGEGGVQFCVELCADALKSRLPCDAATKSLIYKTIAGLLPNDLEVCRACALLVFFSERSVAAYKMVSMLYMLPDQDYHVEHSPIRNQIRFETLQILKKDLYFDPEFWNLLALRTSCLELMSEKVVDEELMEESWLPNDRTKESFACSASTGRSDNATAKNEGGPKEMSCGEAAKKLKLGQGKAGLNNGGGAVKKKAEQRSRYPKGASSQPLRRSFWQLDRIHDAGAGQLRRATRLSEKTNPPKRRIQKPKWLLEDSGSAQEPKLRKHALRHRRAHRSSALKRAENGQAKNAARPKMAAGSPALPAEAPPPPAPAPQIVLELSLPDNELMGTFPEDCNRAKGCPPLLFYKPTLKLPDPSRPARAPHGKEVVLRARDAGMLTQLLHCYARRPKGKGHASKSHGSVSTITRSSAHGSPPKEPRGAGLCEKTHADERAGAPSPLLPSSEKSELQKGLSPEKVAVPNGTETRISAPSANEAPSAVEARQLDDGMTAAEKVTPRPSAASAEAARTFDTRSEQTEDGDGASPPLAATPSGQSPDSPPLRDGRAPVDIDGEENPKALGCRCEMDKTCVDGANTRCQHSHRADDLSTLVTEMLARFPPVEELPGDAETRKRAPDAESQEAALPNQSGVANASGRTPPPPPWIAAGVQGNDGERSTEDDDFEDDETMETEESKLEYRCTFCQRDFKGRRVVAHAMFHFRKDECMFCGGAFKDDLLAMMHLSDHIEKLKRSKEAAANKAQAGPPPDTKDFSDLPRRPSARRVSKKPRKPAGRDGSARLPEAPPLSETRHLRSNDKSPQRKLNGLLGKKTPFESQAEDRRTPRGSHAAAKSRESCAAPIQRRKCAESFQDDVIREERAEPAAKVDCPSDGCAWSTDLSKNRVALLYHALECHHGDVRPLELSLKVAKNRCSICMRVLWSLEHFQHHVERHRLSPRHPCLHLGCAARFKTANQMRRHARKHSPLQAACCSPGCPRLFICLWALNLHEREHYAGKTFKSGRSRTDGADRRVRPRSPTSAARRTRRGGRWSRDAAGIVRAPPPAIKRSAAKEELKTRSESEHANVLKNLSNADSAAQSAKRTLKLRLRKGPTSHAHPGPPKSPLLAVVGRRSKSRHRLKQKMAAVDQAQTFPRRRGRPRKSRKAARDENATEDPGAQSLKSESPHGPRTAAAPTAANTSEMKEEEHRQVEDPGRATEILRRDSKSETTLSGNAVRPKAPSDRGSALTAASRNSLVRALKLRVLNLRKRRASKDAESLEAKSRRKSPREKGEGWLDVGHQKPARSLSPSSGPAEQLPAPDAVRLKNALPKKKKSEKTLPRTSEERHANVTANGCASAAFDVKRKSAKKPRRLMSRVCSAGEKACEATSGASASHASGWKRKFEEEPSDPSSHVDATAADNFKRRSKEEPSDAAGDASASAAGEPSDAARNGSGCPAAVWASESREELSNATSDGFGCAAAAAVWKPEDDTARDDSGSAPSTLKSKSGEESGSASTTSNLKRQSKKEASNATRAGSPASSLVRAATPSKDARRRKNKAARAVKDGDIKRSEKKKHSDKSSAPRRKTQASEGGPVTSGLAGDRVGAPADGDETPERAKDGLGHSPKPPAAKESDVSTLCMDTLAEYGKKHMRAPPTAYLDEKFTAMRKKRKEAESDAGASLDEDLSGGGTLRRLRCAKCLAAFNGAQELHSHLRLRRCSGLFGFDSDDDVNS